MAMNIFKQDQWWIIYPLDVIILNNNKQIIMESPLLHAAM